ncbi:Hypothetical protein FKW44_017358, partial [Caligus rogercresseyi]
MMTNQFDLLSGQDGVGWRICLYVLLSSNKEFQTVASKKLLRVAVILSSDAAPSGISFNFPKMAG